MTVSIEESERFERIDVTLPWGELLHLLVERPKPDVLIEECSYYRVEQRCAYHKCNRLYPVAERGNRIYCIDAHGQAERDQRKKDKPPPSLGKRGK